MTFLTKGPKEKSMSFAGAYGIGLLYALLGLGSVWLVRFASHLYDITMERNK